jgi:hypothetical protein
MALASRRWLRFSLRGLFIALTLICVWFGWSVECRRRQQKLIDAIYELGGEVIYERAPNALDDFLYGANEPIEVNLVSRSPTDAIFARLRRFKKLRILRMRGAYITNAGIAELGTMTALETLELFYPFIGDEGASHLSRLSNLRKLTITDAQLSDTGLRFLEPLQNLQDLTLKNVPITSAGLVHLELLPKLTSLSLKGSLVDQNGIESLAKLKGLKNLDADGPKMSRGDIAALRMAMPWCTVAMSDEERRNAQMFLRGATFP